MLVLAVLGGALIVGEQMRTDQQRIEQLEAAVEKLASMAAPRSKPRPSPQGQLARSRT